MSVWMKRLSLLFTIVAILMMAGCGAIAEKPLKKEELSEVQLAEQREVTIAADVKIPDMFTIQAEKGTESQEGLESELSKEDSDKAIVESVDETVIEDEKPEEQSANETESTGVSKDGETTVSKSNTTNSTDVEKGSNQSSKPTSSSHNSKTTGSAGNASKSKPSNENNSASKEVVEKEETKKESEVQKDTLIYSVVISDSEVPLAPTEVEVKEGDTVLDVLIRVTKDKGIQMDYRGGQGATAYVEGIDNVYEFDRGQGSGWMYRVNGIFPDRGAGVVPLYPGDRVEWLYTTDLGKDLGADLQPFRR